MKKLLLLIALLLNLSSHAQISLIGAKSNQATGFIDIVKWQALDSASLSFYPTSLQGYLLGSSVFDAWNSNYYITGVTPASSGLLSFNSLSNTQTFSPFNTFSNICEIDMSTGKIYTLTADSIDYFSVNAYDILSGTDSLLGVVYEPNTGGIVVDATGFDSNNGILYYIGFDSAGNNCLYSLFVRTPVFSYTKTTLVTTAVVSNFHSVNYDNVNNLIFALQTEFDSSWTSGPIKVVEINKSTGVITERGQLSQLTGIVVGSSSFDQQTGSLLVTGVDTGFVFRMVIFNTGDNTYVTGYIPESVSEIVCDNYAYAKSAYGTTSIIETPSAELATWPAPASSYFMLEVKNFTGNCLLELCDLNGKICLSREIDRSLTEVSTASVKPGMYIARVTNKLKTNFLKVIIL